jgi:hypothetical protein
MLCINARNLNAWYCFDFNGKRTPGKEALSAAGRCEACEKSTPPYEEEPSWLRNDED